MKESGTELPSGELEGTPEVSTQTKTAGLIKLVPKLGKRFLRWVLGVLVVFGLGALLVTFTFYLPLRNQLKEKGKEIQQAGKRITELEGQVQNLSGLEAQNKDLQAQVAKTTLRQQILSARADVALAQLALEQKNPTKARVALNKTPETLKSLAGMLDPNQRKVVTDMQARLNLVVSELDSSANVAQADLEMLMTSLLQFETSYFH